MSTQQADLGLAACGATIAALRGHRNSVDFLLDLPRDEMRIVAAAALMALGEAVRRLPGGEDMAGYIALGLQDSIPQVITGE